MFINVPVDIISYCNTLGDIRPIRMRMENEQHERVTVDIREIAYQKEIKPSGLPIISYGCKLLWDGQERLIELYYHAHTHRWTFHRIVA